jgi:hypothetical protein
LGFPPEAGEAVGISGEAFREDLDRDLAPELAVAGAIHLAHAAGTEQRTDLIRSDLATGEH